jgi:hypothetical protein
MPDIVRIALDEPGRLKWPLRCPRCGATDDLAWHGIQAVRNNRGPGDRGARRPSFLRFPQEAIRFSALMCNTHAPANRAAGALLGRTVGMLALRASIYASLLCLLGSAGFAIRSGSPSLAMPGALVITWWAWCLYGVAGLALLAWARRVAWVRPVRLDPDHDVAIVRFKDDRYARDFRRMNPKATGGAPPSTVAR